MNMDNDWGTLLLNLNGIQVTSAKHFTCREPLFGKLHAHEHQFHITYLVAGRGKAQVGDALIDARPSDAFLLCPGQMHVSIDDEESFYELIEVRFSALSLQAESAVPRLGPMIRVHNTATLVPALERLVAAFLVDMSPANWLARVRLAEALMLLEKEACLSQILESSHSEMDLKVRQMAEYIAVHYAETLTLEQLADQVSVSPSHFSASFKRIMGVSPIEMAIRTRLHHAREMLRTSDYSVAQISDICGFSTPQYFSRLFTHREGVSPREYRR
jgi:AraC-like DNA-binding protein